MIRDNFDKVSDNERALWESKNPNKDYNHFVKQQRKFHDFKLKQKQK